MNLVYIELKNFFLLFCFILLNKKFTIIKNILSQYKAFITNNNALTFYILLYNKLLKKKFFFTILLVL